MNKVKRLLKVSLICIFVAGTVAAFFAWNHLSVLLDPTVLVIPTPKNELIEWKQSGKSIVWRHDNNQLKVAGRFSQFIVPSNAGANFAQIKVPADECQYTLYRGGRNPLVLAVSRNGQIYYLKDAVWKSDKKTIDAVLEDEIALKSGPFLYQEDAYIFLSDDGSDYAQCIEGSFFSNSGYKKSVTSKYIHSIGYSASKNDFYIVDWSDNLVWLKGETLPPFNRSKESDFQMHVGLFSDGTSAGHFGFLRRWKIDYK
jgi:hypothetical protein